MLWKFDSGNLTEIGYWWNTPIIKSYLSANPADAAAELLIWLKEQNYERIKNKLIDRANNLKW